MSISAILATSIVILLHLVFAYAESLGWTQMAARFGYDKDQTETTRMMALNQGAYNAGLACVLGWALATGATAMVVAMLVYVIAMAVVGALTAKASILAIQGAPAVVALGLVLLSSGG